MTPPPTPREASSTQAVVELIATGASLREVLEGITLLVEAESQEGAVCSILLLDGARGELVVGAGPHLPAGLAAACQHLPIGEGVGSCGTAAHRAERVLTSDIDTDPSWVAFKHLAVPFGLAACWSIPILARTRRDGARPTVLGTFAVYAPRPGLPQEREVRILERAVQLASIALEGAAATRALEASEARTRSLLDNASDAIFIHDGSGAIVDVNVAACHSLGYTREELVGAMPSLFDPAVTPESLAELTRAFETLPSVTFEAMHRRKDGVLFPVEIRIGNMAMPDAEPLRVAIARDLTERRRLEAELRQTQKMEAIGRLAGGVAHDFNNLLTVIAGVSDELLAALPPGSPLAEDVATIADAGERAASLTAQLLAFGRRAIVKPTVIDLNETIVRLSRLFGRVLGEDVTLELALDEARPHVEVDPAQLEQVVMNLVLNARDALAGGGTIRLQTVLTTEPTGERRAHLYVYDTGEGIPESVRDKVFEPFFTTKDGRGAGLGLATVYAIVQEAWGTVTVESTMGQGSTFHVVLPGVAAPAPPSKGSRAEQKPGGGTETILVAEDEDVVRKLVVRGLSGYGYKVVAAESGEAALAALAAHSGRIELLLTDVVMPGMGGGDLAERVRALRPEITVLFMSGHTDDATVRRGVSQEGNAFLQKPFNISTLARRVREVLDGVKSP